MTRQTKTRVITFPSNMSRKGGPILRSLKRSRPGHRYATCNKSISPLPCPAAYCCHFDHYLGLVRRSKAGSSWTLCTTTLPQRASTEGLGTTRSSTIEASCATLIGLTSLRYCGSLGHIFSGMDYLSNAPVRAFKRQNPRLSNARERRFR